MWDWRKAAALDSLRARSSRARRLTVAPGTSFESEAALVPGRLENEKTCR